jgi:predicted HTH transcriptional regulator
MKHKKSKHIHNLILQGEHQQLDFKFEISNARKIAKTFAAFANTDGGTLLIGVKDNGNVAGVRSDEEKYMAESAATMYCKPEVEYTTKEWEINGKTVLEIIIPKGDDQPYYAHTDDNKWMVYIRVKDQNILANKILVNALKRKNSGEGTYIKYTDKDKILLEYLENNDLITFSKFRKLAKISPYRAEKILTNFLALDLIEIDISEKSVVYRLSENFRKVQ